MSDQITPGPWEIDQEWIDLVKAEHPDYGAVRIGSSHVSGHIGIANARLIAAAPDMLAALRKAEEALRSCYQVADYPANGRTSQDRALGEVHDAIAKAIGGSGV